MSGDNNSYDADTFWDERCKKLGHTGYADNIVYRYDQPLRLRAVERTLLRKGINVNEETKVLDIGCGTGDLIQLLLGKGATVVGVDISTEVVKRTRERFGGNDRVQILVDKVEALSLPPETFDLVTSVTVLQHITEDDAFLSAVQNIISVVKKGGHLLLLEASPYERPQEQISGHITIRSRIEWIDVFEKAGCILISEFSYPQWGVKFLEKLAKLKKNLLKWRKEKSAKQKPEATTSSLLVGSSSFQRNAVRRLALSLTYFIDRCLNIPFPLKEAKYRILLFRKL